MKTPSTGKAAGAKPRIAQGLPRATAGETIDTATEKHHVSEETKRPKNPGADIMPKDGFVLTIDGKMKARYETEAEASAAATGLKQRFPVVQVAVYDAAARVYTPVNAPAE